MYDIPIQSTKDLKRCHPPQSVCRDPSWCLKCLYACFVGLKCGICCHPHSLDEHPTIALEPLQCSSLKIQTFVCAIQDIQAATAATMTTKPFK